MYLPDEFLDRYKNLIQDFIETDVSSTLLWYRYIDIPTMFGEGSGKKHKSVEILAQKSYNYMRTWPINSSSKAGDIDNENMVLFISKRHLETLGLLEADGTIKVDIARDRFLVDNLLYKCFGETLVAHSKNHELLFMITLVRDKDNIVIDLIS